jgi:hypothetical protein
MLGRRKDEARSTKQKMTCLPWLCPAYFSNVSLYGTLVIISAAVPADIVAELFPCSVTASARPFASLQPFSDGNLPRLLAARTGGEFPRKGIELRRVEGAGTTINAAYLLEPKEHDPELFIRRVESKSCPRDP